MNKLPQYSALRWPPDLQLAKIHMKCICPGKQNNEGIQCPCCFRNQKIAITNWFKRNINKDFKSYGGGVPNYFQLMKYCAIALLIFSLVFVPFHIFIIQTVQPKIGQYCPKIPTIDCDCSFVLHIFTFCNTRVIIQTLIQMQQPPKAHAFIAVQLISFLYLICATIGMKIWLQRVNAQQIVMQSKIYSDYSLLIKNIPKYYQIDDVKRQLQKIIPNLQICQLFFVYQIAQLQLKFKKLLDFHFYVEFMKQSVATNRGFTTQQVHQNIIQYGLLYQQINQLKNKLVLNNGRAIAVFNRFQHKKIIYHALKINQCQKLSFHSMKALGMGKQLDIVADTLCQPQQIIWKNIGESSQKKTIVRIKTTVIGFGFMIIGFGVLSYPMLLVSTKNLIDSSILFTMLNLLISLLLQILSVVFRLILMRILPTRHASTRYSQSYFIVITTIVFHFFFYIVSPTIFFVAVQQITQNQKLKQFFTAVTIFMLMTVIIACFDLRYRIFQRKINNILSHWALWSKYCQVRLHQQIKWPSFPIQFKLMVLFNIWSFSAFYIFQIPYLSIIFCVVITIIYMIDKRNIYCHYKMQVFQSNELQIKVQRDYIFMFLICVCCGYSVSVYYTWQYIFIGVVFILSFLANWLLSYRQQQKQVLIQRTSRSKTLTQNINLQGRNRQSSMLCQLAQRQLLQNILFIQDASTVSLGSYSYNFGYKDLYDIYLSQFKNKQITALLDQTYKQYKNPNYSVEEQITQISQRKSQITQFTKIQPSEKKVVKYSKLVKQSIPVINSLKQKQSFQMSSITQSITK